MKITNSGNWENATKQFPRFACEERLKQFVAVNCKKEVPTVLQSYCQAALDSKQDESSGGVTSFKHTNGYSTTLLKTNYQSVTGLEIKKHIPSFKGSNLIIAVLPDVSYHK